MHSVFKGLIVLSVALGSWLFGHASTPAPQGEKKQGDKKEAGMPAIELTAEHKWLAEDAGKWKAVGKMMSGPGTWTPINGVQTNTMQKGGLWQVQDFDGGSFAGHGLAGYDAMKKKFVAVWVDNLMGEMDLAEGTLSADKKVLTLTFTNNGMGQPTVMTEVITRKDANTTLFELSMPGEGGKPMKLVEITYTRM
jgi:hypothetical protein